MNLQLPLVVSDITGVTGLRILRDIVAGQRDPHRLAAHRDPRCHASDGRDRRGLDGPLPAGARLRLATEPRALRHVSEQLAACDAPSRPMCRPSTATVAAAGHAAPAAARAAPAREQRPAHSTSARPCII